MKWTESRPFFFELQSMSWIEDVACRQFCKLVNAKLKKSSLLFNKADRALNLQCTILFWQQNIYIFFLLGSKTQKTVTGKTSLTSKPDPAKTDNPTTQKTEKPTTPTQAPKVNPFMEMCKASPTAVLPHPQSCAKQVDCSLVMKGMVGVMECPFPTLWNTDTKRCDNPFTVKCGTRWEPKDACKDNL